MEFLIDYFKHIRHEELLRHMVKILNDSLAEAFFGHITEMISGNNLTFLQMARLLASKAFHYLLIVLSSSDNLGVTVRRTRDEHAGTYFYNSIDDCSGENAKSLLWLFFSARHESLFTTEQQSRAKKNNHNSENMLFIGRFNVSALVCSEIPRSKKSPIDYLGCRNPNSIYLNPIIHNEIDDIISSLQNGKSTRPFSIPVKLLKVLKPYISQPLANIFNQSIILGIFPDKLKYAKIIPIHKKGSPTDASNYRPISLLSIFIKIFKKLMHKRLYEFLDKMNIFYFNLASERNTRPIMHLSV